jgi:hypothetical protein
MSNAMVLAPKSMGEAMEFSKTLAKSSMVPQAFKNKPEDILVAVQWGYEVGLSPMQALQNIAVINGKPSIYGDAALALAQGNPEYAGHKEWQTGEGDKAVAHCLFKRVRHGQTIETERTFSVADAKAARLWGKPGPWQQYPARMLQMRARGFALRDAFADALRGVITAEEARDIPVGPGQAPTSGPANPLDAVAPPPTTPTEAVARTAPIDVEVEDIPDDQPPAEPAPAPAADLYVQGPKGPIGQPVAPAAFGSAYADAMLKIYRASKVKPEDRRHKLKELHDANAALLEQHCPPDHIEELEAKRLKFIRSLSVSAKEQGDGTSE